MEGALRIDEKKVTPDFTADFAVTGTGKLFPPGALSVIHARAGGRVRSRYRDLGQRLLAVEKVTFSSRSAAFAHLASRRRGGTRLGAPDRFTKSLSWAFLRHPVTMATPADSVILEEEIDENYEPTHDGAQNRSEPPVLNPRSRPPAPATSAVPSLPPREKKSHDTRHRDPDSPRPRPHPPLYPVQR